MPSSHARWRRKLKSSRWRNTTGAILAGSLLSCAPSLVPLEPRIALPDVLADPSVAAPSALAAVERAYFRENGLMVPVVGVTPARIRDSFNAPRSGGRIHRAFDIPAPRGTPVVAAMGGRILALRNNALGGTTVYMIDEANRFVYYYAHLDRYADNVSEGREVPRGHVLGYVGTTGNSPPNAPHLHFQVLRVERQRRDWWNGTAVDVREYFSLAGRQR